MTTTLEELLSKYPKAVKAIGIADYKQRDRLGVIVRIKDYAYLNNIGDHAMDSVADLLAAIESHLTASEPLTDEEIEKMKWDYRGARVGPPGFIALHAANAENAANACAAQNADIDRLHAEIRRLRKGGA